MSQMRKNAKAFAESGTVPGDIMLAKATALQAALGPQLVEQRWAKTEADKVEEVLASATPTFRKEWGSARQSKMEEFRKIEENAALKIEETLASLDALQLDSAEAIGVNVSAAAEGYENALDEANLGAMSRDELTNKLELFANRNAVHHVAKDDEVEIVDTATGTTKKAKIQHVLDDDTYEVAVFQVFIMQNQPYEEGYTLSKIAHDKGHKDDIRIVKRKDIYAKPKDLLQEVTPQDVANTDEGFLIYMRRDAEQAASFLKEFGPRAAKAASSKVSSAGTGAVECTVAPLKGLARVMEKVQGKYRGNYAKVKDLARMTFECTTNEAVAATVDQVKGDPNLKVLLVKDRLRPTFDASLTGGYRDVLINARHLPSGHILEIQITLKTLLAIKNSDLGHASYELVRRLDLNDQSNTKVRGAATAQVIKGVKRGKIKDLTVDDGGTMTEVLFDDLLDALASPTCMLEALEMNSSGDRFKLPPGKSVSDLLTKGVVKQLKPRLKVFKVNRTCTDTNCAFPEELYDFTKLEDLQMSQNPKVTGQFSPKIGQLVNLRKIFIWESGMAGPIPKEMGNLTKMETCFLYDPHTFAFKCEKSEWQAYKKPYGSFAEAFAHYAQ